MTEAIPSPPVAEVPFNAQFQRSYLTDGIGGEELRSSRASSCSTHRTASRASASWATAPSWSRRSTRFERRLFTYLSLFGIGMIAINAVAILLGLRPLGRVREALAMVREGTAQRLDGRFPAEIEPLANETNALIENNRRIVERSRTQVGNLAHSLKTPLAVLLNEGARARRRQGHADLRTGGGHAEQLEHYLQRARVAAQRDSVVYRTPVTPLLERLVRVIEKLGRMTDIADAAGRARSSLPASARISRRSSAICSKTR